LALRVSIPRQRWAILVLFTIELTLVLASSGVLPYNCKIKGVYG
jgi:hypothetical protein